MSTDKDQSGRFQFFPATHIAGVAAIALLLLIVLVWPSDEKQEPHQQRLTFNLPESEPENATQSGSASATATQSQARRGSDQVRPGDSLSVLFSRNNLSARDVIDIASSVSKDVIKLRPGQQLNWTTSNDGKIQSMDIILSPLALNRITRLPEGGFKNQLVEKTAQRYPKYAHVTINTSLFYDGNKAGVPEQILIRLAGIFAWDIDFALDIRTGDSFTLVYEEIFLNGEKIGNGDILATRFVNRGRTYTAVRYVDRKGEANYFTPAGLSMRKEFLRNPIDFARISSRFNLRRKHPVLNRIRAHKGTDYAAVTGTPIKSAGDGKVIFAGRRGGYGNTVIIQHGTRYQTLYAHMNGFHRSVRRGRKVRQGQVIGYVGTTGLSTGPHLHYEFRVDGVHRDSLKVKLPKAKSILSSEKSRFLKQAKEMAAILDNVAVSTH